MKTRNLATVLLIALTISLTPAMAQGRGGGSHGSHSSSSSSSARSSHSSSSSSHASSSRSMSSSHSSGATMRSSSPSPSRSTGGPSHNSAVNRSNNSHNAGHVSANRNSVNVNRSTNIGRPSSSSPSRVRTDANGTPRSIDRRPPRTVNNYRLNEVAKGRPSKPNKPGNDRRPDHRPNSNPNGNHNGNNHNGINGGNHHNPPARGGNPPHNNNRYARPGVPGPMPPSHRPIHPAPYFHHPYLHHTIHMHPIVWHPAPPRPLFWPGFWLYCNSYWYDYHVTDAIVVNRYVKETYNLEMISYVMSDDLMYAIVKDNSGDTYLQVYNKEDKLLAEHEISKKYIKTEIDRENGGCWIFKKKDKDPMLFIYSNGELLIYEAD